MLLTVAESGCLMNYVATPAAFEKGRKADEAGEPNVVVAARRRNSPVYVKAKKLRLLTVYDETAQEAVAVNSVMTGGAVMAVGAIGLFAGGLALLFQDDPTGACPKNTLCGNRFGAPPLLTLGGAAFAVGVFLIFWGSYRPREEVRGKISVDANGVLHF